jgi:hypothetical protein
MLKKINDHDLLRHAEGFKHSFLSLAVLVVVTCTVLLPPALLLCVTSTQNVIGQLIVHSNITSILSELNLLCQLRHMQLSFGNSGKLTYGLDIEARLKLPK